MAEFNADVKKIKAAIGIASDTAANWAAQNLAAPADMWLLESDTGFLKVSKNNIAYNDLPYKVQECFTPAMKTLLDNANAANGVAKLDADGRLTLDQLPAGLADGITAGVIHYVSDIAARDALTGSDRNGLVFVIDASADTTVTAGSAVYIWRDDLVGDGTQQAPAGDWEKILEKESLDIDLTPYFNKNTMTLDDITDGSTYVRIAATWKAEMDDLKAHALRDDDTIHIAGPNAEELKAMLSVVA